MKNIASIIILFLLPMLSIAQVGVRTESPQGIFHIDPQSNTTSSSATYSDDVIVTNSGNVGSGTLTPSNKLEIHGTSQPVLKIADGTQANGRRLVSDSNGVGTWRTPSTEMHRIVGPNMLGLIPPVSQPKYSGHSITLPQGTWIIRYNLTWHITFNPGVAYANTVCYIDVFLATNQNAPHNILNGSWTIVPVPYGTSYTSSQVSIVYNVTQPTQTIYLCSYFNGNSGSSVDAIQEIRSYDPTPRSNVLEAVKW